MQSKALKFVAFFFTVLPLIFIAVGGYFAWDQQRKLSTFQPTTGVVERAWVDRNTGGDSTTYAPKVLVRYSVNGTEYTGDQVFPMEFYSSARSQAERIVSQYTQGQTVTVFHDPNAPERSFLIPEASFFPYIFMLFPLIFISVGLGVGLYALAQSKADRSEPQPAMEGFFILTTSDTIKSRLIRYGVITALWWAGGLLVTGHFLFAGGQMTLLPTITLSIVGGFALIVTGLLLYNVRLHQQVHDALVMIDRREPRLGDQLLVYVEQLVKRGLQVNELTVKLTCEEQQMTGSGKNSTVQTTELYASEQKLIPDGQPLPGEALRFTGELLIPADQPESKTTGSHPLHYWNIQIHTDIAAGPDYRARFPLRVRSGPIPTPTAHEPFEPSLTMPV